MRAGAFAETRVIELLERRFVPYFFNNGGPGVGKNAEAKAFIDGQTENPWAYFAAFTPDGEIVGETELYADKDAVFAWLRELLELYPDYAWESEEERAVVAAAHEGPAERLAAGRLLDALGDYAAAKPHYVGLKSRGIEDPVAREAALSLARIHRYEKAWRLHSQLTSAAIASGVDDPTWIGAMRLERAHRLLASRKYDTARDELQRLAQEGTGEPWLSAAHFYAGVACWFEGDRDWAKLHWCWVHENLPDDRLFPRARIAAAAEGMPYANPELGGFEANVGNIGPHNIADAVNQALDVYEAMLPFWERGELRAEREVGELPDPSEVDDPEALVRRLRDGNPHVQANNVVVARLEELGEVCFGALIAAVDDVDFRGRGYAAWALARVIKATGSKDEAAWARLRKAAEEDDDDYVRTLARSGLNRM